MAGRQRWSTLWKVACALAFAGMAAITVDAHAQNAERGRQLYENHCQVCHTAQVHGRKNRASLTLADLREIVTQWQDNQRLRWSREEIDDVTHYLAITKYHFSTSLVPSVRVAVIAPPAGR